MSLVLDLTKTTSLALVTVHIKLKKSHRRKLILYLVKASRK